MLHLLDSAYHSKYGCLGVLRSPDSKTSKRRRAQEEKNSPDFCHSWPESVHSNPLRMVASSSRPLRRTTSLRSSPPLSGTQPLLWISQMRARCGRTTGTTMILRTTSRQCSGRNFRRPQGRSKSGIETGIKAAKVAKMEVDLGLC